MIDELHSTSTRRNRTKEHFKLALIKLIKEKGYHAISVKDIVDAAAYNRSTFYVHYQDKIDLAEELLKTMLEGLEASVGVPYEHGQTVYTSKLNAPSFNIVAYIYEHRDFFELIKYDDTLPGLHTELPRTIQNIYNEQFVFETINNMPVNMDYFKQYTAYGFYGLIINWIREDFKESQEAFIQAVIDLTRTHMHSFKFVGNKIRSEGGTT
ncbi:TetR family transcriptional regulator [Paenibacillus cellulosilyticus]|uniref:TetR family transcriptional regulator n=1 Tax=Paenibacillus cellulosilyticus TaxID=375489 RepID=A0A2V2Z2N5_9BACL|nr:TetR/AcrR family transcriptional regulator [Paenibacillus cellulosilyticus]PWW07375.1 TetR family transcriptional regulator [Paenibacillus cellulosilyticus]QKS44456.1 TetR/AcrR family transcriptional regulator [Paenibacillus cellulosilyticus]